MIFFLIKKTVLYFIYSAVAQTDLLSDLVEYLHILEVNNSLVIPEVHANLYIKRL